VDSGVGRSSLGRCQVKGDGEGAVVGGSAWSVAT
jgi:hypothetical protein